MAEQERKNTPVVTAKRKHRELMVDDLEAQGAEVKGGNATSSEQDRATFHPTLVDGCGNS